MRPGPPCPRLIRTLALPIILGWVLLIVVLNVVVPQLEEVGKLRSVSMTPDAAPSMISMQHIGQVFEEFDSNSAAMIVLEGDKPLGDDAHAYYDQLIKQARGRHQARRTRAGLLERPAHRIRVAEQ